MSEKDPMSTFFPEGQSTVPPPPANSTGDYIDPPDNVDYDAIDEEFAPRARQRLGVFTGLLALALAIGIGFYGGVVVQKNKGGSSTTAARAALAGAAARAGRAGGFGAGGFGAGGFGGAEGAGGGTGAGAPGATSAPTPSVIGTVTSIKGLALVVTNLGGTKVNVTMTAATTITAKIAGLKVGETVSVVGKVGAGGTVAATSITVQ
jgi:hypothetical protein